MKSESIKGATRWQAALALMAVIGPGIITASVDNDAGGITTYSLAGAQFGYGFLWTLVPITVALVIFQEMSARLGVVTGKGFSDLIRERFGVRWTTVVLLALFVANLGNILAEFSGVAASMEIFGVSKYVSVPLAGAFVWWLAVKGDRNLVERVFLAAILFYVTYIISGVLAGPNWPAVMAATVVPTWSFKADYLSMFIGMVGTTIAPWMQFYIQSSVVDKRLQMKDYWLTRWDVVVGCIVCDVVAFFIVVACAETIYKHGLHVETAKDAAQALAPFAGHWAEALFAFGLFNASVIAASILPLTTSYAICEGMGFESGLDHSFKKAPVFYGLYTVLIILGGGLILLPNAPLIAIMYWSQVANGVLLPFVLILMLLLINRKRLMGEYVNGRLLNIFAWSATVFMIGLTGLLVATLLFPTLLNGH